MTKHISWIFLLWISFSAIAEDSGTVPLELRLNQAKIGLSDVTVWINVDDSKGNQLSGLQVGQFSANIGEWTAVPQTLKPFADSGEGVAYVFMIDVSKSLSVNHFEQMKTSLVTWVNQLRDLDSAAILTFGSKVELLQDFSRDKEVLKRSISSLALTDEKTLFYEAILRGLELGKRSDAGLPRRQVLIVLSDGVDDAPPGSPKQDEVLRFLHEHQIPVYAISVKHQPQGSKEKLGVDNLGVIVRASGGLLLESDANGSLIDAYAKQYQSIQKSWVLNVNCPDCKFDAKSYPLVVTFRDSNRVLSDSLELPPLIKAPESKNAPESKPNNPPNSSDSANLPKPSLLPDSNARFWLDRNWLWGFILALTGGALFIYIIYLLKHRKPLVAISKVAPYFHGESQLDLHNEPPQQKADEPSISQASVNPVKGSNGIKLLLTIVSGQEKGRRYQITLTGSVSLGCGQDNNICIVGDKLVSTKHAEIIRNDKGLLFLKELKLNSGTLLNGVPIKSHHLLQEGDLFVLGRTELRINILEN